MNTKRDGNKKEYLFNPRRIFLGLFLLLLLINIGLGPVGINLLHILVNKISAPEHKSMLDQGAEWQVLGTIFPAAERVSPRSSTNVPAILQAIAALRQDRFANAATWFLSAVNDSSPPPGQNTFFVSPWIKVMADNSLLLDGESYPWSIRSDSAKSAAIEPNGQNMGKFRCDSPDEDEGRAIFYWNQPLPIQYHHTAVLKTNIAAGTTFIFETVIDGNITRHLVESGTGTTTTYYVPMEGDRIDLMYIALFRNDQSQTDAPCQAIIHNISFLLDEDLK